MYLATSKKLGPIAKRREYLVDDAAFYELMRRANAKQKALCIHIINQLISQNTCPMQIFLTGPAGSGTKFSIGLLMEIYNRFIDNDGYCNAYITCVLTTNESVAINGGTIQATFKITQGTL